MPGAKDARTANALEASRGAVLAVHAAAGLATAGGLRSAARLLRAAEGLLRTAVAELGTPPASPAVDHGGPPKVPRRRRPRGRGGLKEADEQYEKMDVVEEKSQEEEVAIVAEMDGGAAAGAAAAQGAVDVAMELPPDDWADALPIVHGRPRRAGGSGSGKGRDNGEVSGGAGKDKSDARVQLAQRAADLSSRLGHRIANHAPLSDAELHSLVGLLERELAARGGGLAEGGRGPPPRGWRRS
ncbi:unnamed protein product [Prorocentrum cordatum]|uniref:Uncharacterized protein n=1 Tax=Prorocentrum cordatum TaxID=2364126 RepID=A0ABN9SP59_9DINO|nr:unnamed protein product [Polarella glacialis]